MATSGGTRGVGPERAYAPRLPRSGTVVLSAEESHHLVRVRRARAGDEVVLFDGVGGSALGRLVDERATGASVEWVAPYPDREPRRAVFVETSVPGPSRLDELVASLAELGVTAWGPIVCERSDRKFVDALERRAERLGRLLIEAAKVSGRSRLMTIAVPREFADAVARDAASSGAGVGDGVGGARGGVTVLLDPDPAAPLLRDVLASRCEPHVAVRLIVGPEGGFTPAELERATAAGIASASLGACALRTELAAVAAAAIALCD